MAEDDAVPVEDYLLVLRGVPAAGGAQAGKMSGFSIERLMRGKSSLDLSPAGEKQ